MADIQMLARLWEAMPRSLRPLIVNPHVGTAEAALNTDEKWRRKIATLVPGSAPRRFQWAGWAAYRKGKGLPPPELEP